MSKLRKMWRAGLATSVGLLVVMCSSVAFASTSSSGAGLSETGLGNMSSWLGSLADAVTGPIGRGVAIVVLAVSAFYMAAGQGDGWRKLAPVIIGSLAVIAAPTIIEQIGFGGLF